MSCNASEINFDGLVGPTHHYGGLSWDNIASQRHAGDICQPLHRIQLRIGPMLLKNIKHKELLSPSR